MSWSAPDEWSRWDPDRLLQCPYDQSHMIRAKRYPHHLLKCRKNHPDRDFVNCPFNAKHVMLRSEFRQHVSRCPDRTVVEQYSYKGSEKDEAGFYFKGDTSVPSYHKTDNIQWGCEYWDDDDEGQNTPQIHEMDFTASYQQSEAGLRDTSSLSPEEQRQFKRSLKRDAVLKGSNSVGGIATPWKSSPVATNNHRQEYSSNSSHNPIFDHCMEQMLVQSNSTIMGQQNPNLSSGNKAWPRTYGSPTASTSISQKGSPCLAGVGRARLNAEARKNNFGGVCYSPPKALDDYKRNTSAVGRGRGVLGFMLSSET